MGFCKCIFTVAALMSMPGLAGAADNQFRTSLDSRSRSVGVGKSSLPLLMRLPGAGRDAVSAKVLARLRDSRKIAASLSSGNSSVRKDSSLVGNSAWALRVYSDGTKVKFKDLHYLVKHPEIIRKATQRMPQADAERQARAFIENELAELVKVGANETLEPMKTIYETRQAHNVKLSQPEPAEVVSQTVVFTRTVEGSAILGPGSKVAVQLANDGTVVAFDYDWAELAPAGETQAVLELAAINERASALAGLNMKGGQATTKRFECGYADLGARRIGSGGVLQAACAVHYLVQQPQQGVSAGRVDLVPAGVAVRSDAAWREAQALCITGDVCKASILTPALPGPNNPN